MSILFTLTFGIFEDLEGTFLCNKQVASLSYLGQVRRQRHVIRGRLNLKVADSQKEMLFFG